jgi:predicted phosphodiesterase
LGKYINSCPALDERSQDGIIMKDTSISGLLGRLHLVIRSKAHDYAWLEEHFPKAAYASVKGDISRFVDSNHAGPIQRIMGSGKTADLATGDRVYRFEVYHPHVGGLDGLKILHLSDTHFNTRVSFKDRIKALSPLSREKFDMVVHTGDVVDRRANGFTEEHLAFLDSLKAFYGKYFVLGNHDHDFGDASEIVDKMRSAGFYDVSNETRRFLHNGMQFSLSGLDDHLSGRPDPGRLSPNPNHFNMLLLHSLDGLTAESPPVFDLVLSGHVHAGEPNLGIVNGFDYLMMTGILLDLNNHTNGFKYLTDRTLSYVHPGGYSNARDGYKVPRFLSDRQGVTVLTLRRA